MPRGTFLHPVIYVFHSVIFPLVGVKPSCTSNALSVVLFLSPHRSGRIWAESREHESQSSRRNLLARHVASGHCQVRRCRRRTTSRLLRRILARRTRLGAEIPRRARPFKSPRLHAAPLCASPQRRLALR